MQHGQGTAPVVPASSGDAPQLSMSCEVAESAAAMRTARTQLRELVARWQLDERVANAILDVAHELLVNAHQHGTPPVHLTMVASTDEVRVEVRDASPRPARLLPYRPGLSDHGLGLQLVRQLSAQWGQASTEDGKLLWATFPRRVTRTA